MKPGIHDITADEYHADAVADTPSLSSSIASILCSQSPKHAWTAHPKLNPDFVREERETFDLGTVAHAIMLNGPSVVEVVHADDWRTKAAKEARAEIRERGKVPLLAHRHAEVEAMVEAARVQLLNHHARPFPFSDGAAEQTLVWEEPGDVMCRARLDWLHDDGGTVDDYKTTSKSANPESWSRALFNSGADVQAAMYLRGLEALTGITADYRWIVQETYPPFALSVIAPGPDVMTIASKKVEYAIGLWRECLANDSWPAYPLEVCWATLPAYEEARWLAVEELAA